ncbi:FGGY family carbohydrate kinase [Herbiconiux daphne]|uniref:FGGY family carbohydrate kinase n=1 Tax=Herbiconiux daphne TaxID=2970914 RepID=A0ABT2H8E5_9MICO|nr:FGGY family carbohydrate kinase [Herbiconiux daphne]MCS5736231.1 FGGY family carbohydrate kinase [Herbiconiux daphne]
MTGVTIGLDLGTTSVKGVLLHPDEGILASAGRTNRLSSPHAGWAEASPSQWRENALSIIAELAAVAARSAHTVTAVGTSGMVPAVVAIGGNGEPTRPAILQNDSRAHHEVAEMARLLETKHPLERTGSPVTQQSVGPTALWLERHEPEVWHRTSLIVGSYDWLLMALGAEAHVERNWAIESGLFDLAAAEFEPAITAGHLQGRLAPAVSSGTVVGTMSSALAAACGLTGEVSLVVGGADHVLSAVGAGLATGGDWLVKLGGAGDILAVSGTPVVDERFYLDAHPVPGLWLPNGCMATSGSLVRWMQDVLQEDDLAALDARAASRPAAEVLCLPYFLGEKSPLNDPELRGVFAGLHLGTDRYDLYRAVLEGVAFGFRHNAEALRSAGVPLDAATVSDGGANSMLWKRIHASVLATPLRTLRHHPGASLGAAVAAAIGVGDLPGWQAMARFVLPGVTVDPEPQLVDRYDEAYALWRQLGDSTGAVMHALSRRR